MGHILDDEKYRILKFVHLIIYYAEDNGCEILSMCHVLKYLIDSSVPLIDAENLEGIHKIPPEDWQDLVKDLKGSVFSSFFFFSSYINIDCDEINYSVILTLI